LRNIRQTADALTDDTLKVVMISDYLCNISKNTRMKTKIPKSDLTNSGIGKIFSTNQRKIYALL